MFRTLPVSPSCHHHDADPVTRSCSLHTLYPVSRNRPRPQFHHLLHRRSAVYKHRVRVGCFWPRKLSKSRDIPWFIEQRRITRDAPAVAPDPKRGIPFQEMHTVIVPRVTSFLDFGPLDLPSLFPPPPQDDVSGPVSQRVSS